MSTLLAIVHDSARPGPDGRVHAFLRQSVSRDVLAVPLPAGDDTARTRLTIVAKHAADSRTGDSWFRGTLVDPERRAVVLGPDGWDAHRHLAAESTGEFYLVRWGRDLAGAVPPGTPSSDHLPAVRVDRDVFGNGRLFMTAFDGGVAVSESLLVLAALRRGLGAPLTVAARPLLARAAHGQLAAQLMSTATMFEEITLVRSGQGVLLRTSGVVPFGTTTPARVAVTVEDDFRDVLRTAATRIAALTAAVSDVEDCPANLSLSGGRDCRVVLAGARAMGVEKRIHTATMNGRGARQRDYAVARGLARDFSLTWNEPEVTPDDLRDGHRPVQGDRLTRWGVSLAGVYDALKGGSAGEPRIRMSGLGAGAIKGAGLWQPWDRATARLAEERDLRRRPAAVEALADEGRAGLAAYGIPADAPDASAMFYIAYRNALHATAGRAGVDMTAVMPLNDLPLARLGHTVVDDPRQGRVPRSTLHELVLDLIVLLDPELAAYEYDEPGRNVDAAWVARRRSELGGPLDLTGAEPYTVLGSPYSDPRGPSDLAKRVAGQVGFAGGLETESVLAGAEDDVELIPDPVTRDTWAKVVRAALEVVGRGADVRTNGQISKAASLKLLRTTL